ncbi:hypothetical protein [Tomitella cavernea]|uniref:7-cyano-7-deazaguanine synthase n=1 Tax=Tomitella cavernea TaxID=1387982 RepID=A0ABP9CCL9_9ACTN|nr:hypothetical protein [Tomitella cavernea]
MTAETFTVNVLDRPDHEAAAEFSWGDKIYTIETSANVTLRNTATAWLPPATIMAMKKDLPLHIDSTVDPKTLKGANEAQQLLHSWWPEELHEINIDATANTPSPKSSRGIGCFFSGGLDSFYSAITNAPKITHLIFVHGFDIFLNSTEHYNSALDAMRATAEEMGKTLIEVRTNIVHTVGHGRDWMLAHGAAMAHVALLLSDHLNSAIIPASHYVDNIVPHGSHPDLDPLWSSTSLSFVYDGIEANRAEKALRASTSRTALKHLRVCFWNRSDIQNCGECEKCVRTAVNMRIAGASDKFTAIPTTDLIKSISRVEFKRDNEKYFLAENIRALEQSDRADPDLLNALVTASSRSTSQKARALLWSNYIYAKMTCILIGQKSRGSLSGLHQRLGKVQ